MPQRQNSDRLERLEEQMLADRVRRLAEHCGFDAHELHLELDHTAEVLESCGGDHERLMEVLSAETGISVEEYRQAAEGHDPLVSEIWHGSR